LQFCLKRKMIYIGLLILLIMHFCADALELVQMSNEELSNWYTDYDVCMLTKRGNNHQKCKHLVKTEYDLLCSSVYWCQYSPDSLRMRPVQYGKYTNETFYLNNNPKHTPITDFLVNLNQSNRALIMLGDSITRDSLKGLACSLFRETPTASVDPFLGKNKFGITEYTFTIPIREEEGSSKKILIIKLFYLAVWSEFIMKGLENIDVAWINKYGPSTMNWFIGYIKDLDETTDFSGFVLTANIGIHERKKAGPKWHAAKLATIFRYLQSPYFLRHPNKNNHFFFRESSVQHFGVQPFGTFNMHASKTWYYGSPKNEHKCLPINETMGEYRGNYWLPSGEEGAFKISAEPYDYTPFLSRINITATTATKKYDYNRECTKCNPDYFRIPFRDLSNIYYDAKHSSDKSVNWKNFDCTHYCGYLPILWRSYFNEIISRL
jgi:hypothetical protein